MIRSKLCLAAESVVIDRQSNATSFFNLLESMKSEGFPFVLPKISVFILWERESTDPTQYTSNLRISFGTEELVNQIFNIDFQGQLRTRSVLQMAGLLIPRPGIVTFHAQIQDPEVSAQYSFDITGNQPEIVATQA